MESKTLNYNFKLDVVVKKELEVNVSQNQLQSTKTLIQTYQNHFELSSPSNQNKNTFLYLAIEIF